MNGSDKYMGQKWQVMKHLMNNQTITAYDAFSLYGIMRLSSIIHRLTHDSGQNIVGYWVDKGDRRYYEYRLKDLKGRRNGE